MPVGSPNRVILGQVYFFLSKVNNLFSLDDQFSSVQFSRSVVSNSLWLHGLQDTRLPCPSPTPRACSNSCLSQWCHPTISSSVVPFSSYFQSFPESGSFQMSQFFASGGQSVGISASLQVIPMNIQSWFPLGWLVGSPCSPCSPRDSQESSPNTTVQKPQFSSWLMETLKYCVKLVMYYRLWKMLNVE